MTKMSLHGRTENASALDIEWLNKRDATRNREKSIVFTLVKGIKIKSNAPIHEQNALNFCVTFHLTTTIIIENKYA